MPPAASSRLKRETSSTSLSSRIQAWQASADNRRRHSPGVMHRYPSTLTCSREKAASTSRSSILSISNVNSSDGDSEGNCSDSDDGEAMKDFINKEHDRVSSGKGKACHASVVTETPSSSSKTILGSSTLSTSTELGEIQQSVRRLRAQRTNVERLGQRNEELERQLSEKKAENETLRREIFTLRGTEQENVAYLQSVKLLEQRARGLEEACSTKRLELRSTTEKLNYAEQEREQLRQELQNARQDYEEDSAVLKAKNDKLLQRIEQLEHSHGAQTDDRKRVERHWKQKMKAATRNSSQTIDTLQQQLERSCKETGKLETEVRELEEQVQNLLATTVRQTTVIEECERAISDTKAQQQQTQQNYEEQLQLACELSAKTQRLEAQVASLKVSKGSELIDLETKMNQLECKVATRNDQLRAAEENLRQKEKELEVMQRAYVTRDHNRLHTEEATKRNDRKLKSEISELQIALRDVSHEKTMLSEQVIELQEQLETERKDRSRWATARLQLLTEFCDEESKLSSALSHHHGLPSDDRRSCHEERSKISSRKTKSRRNKVADDKSYDGDESEDEQRRSSIVFG